MVDDGISGKIAFVTGAATKMGMGRAIALRLAGAGAHVAILDKYAKPKTNYPGDAGWGGLEEELKEIKAFGVEGLVIEADVASSNDCKEATAKVLEKFGKIDLFVHSAAIRGPVNVPVVDLSEEDWRAQMDVNLTGTFPHLAARGPAYGEKGRPRQDDSHIVRGSQSRRSRECRLYRVQVGRPRIRQEAWPWSLHRCISMSIPFARAISIQTFGTNGSTNSRRY